MAQFVVHFGWQEVRARIIERIKLYGFEVLFGDLEAPKTGILDGLRIIVDPGVPIELQCFLLLHLFGHSVQWTAPSLTDTIKNLQTATSHEEFIQILHNYEALAATYGLQLLHEAGINNADQWYADMVATDWEYVRRYYVTGAIPELNECRVNYAPLITPQPIPELKQREVEVRFAF